MNTLTIMVGLPGSGKDTYIKEHLKDAIVLSSDDLRVEMYGYEDQTHNKEVFAELERRTIEYGKEGKDVVYNATNLVRKRRVALATKMRKYYSRIEVIVVAAPIAELLERNITREERHLPEDKLKEMIKTIQVPVKYEYTYDDIKYIYTGTIEDCEIANLPLLMDYSQHNKHHSEELGKHIMRVVEGCAGHEIARHAAFYHDLGKPFCKTVDDEGYYHFFSHNFVSAYMFLTDKLMGHKIMDDLLQSIMLMIEMHDWIFNFQHDIGAMRSHYDKKYIGLTDKYWEELEVLTKADRLRP